MAGGIVGHIAGDKLALRAVKAVDSHGIAGGKGNALLLGKAGPAQIEQQLAALGGVNQQALRLQLNHCAAQRQPIVLNGFAGTVALAHLPLAVAALLAHLALARPFSLPLAAALALALRRAYLAGGQRSKIGHFQRAVTLVSIVNAHANSAN